MFKIEMRMFRFNTFAMYHESSTGYLLSTYPIQQTDYNLINTRCTENGLRCNGHGYGHTTELHL